MTPERHLRPNLTVQDEIEKEGNGRDNGVVPPEFRVVNGVSSCLQDIGEDTIFSWGLADNQLANCRKNLYVGDRLVK